MSVPTLGAAQIDALREMGNIGAGTAATALSQMTGQTVQMGIPTVSLLPVEEIAAHTGPADRVVVAIFLGVHGDADGHMLFVIDEEPAHAMVGILMGGMAAAAEDGSFSEIELSALQEIGNILAGSYLNALATITGLRLEPTPPAVGVDLAGALLGTALAEVAMNADSAILIESALGDDDTPSLGDVLFLPTAEGLGVVLAKLGLA